MELSRQSCFTAMLFLVVLSHMLSTAELFHN